MKKGTKPEVLELQKNPFVEQWMAGVASRGGGSEDTQRGYIYSFNRMLGYLEETPDSLIKKAKKDISTIEKALTLWGFRAEKAGMNRSTRVDHEITVRSFLKHNGLILRTPVPKRRKTVGRDVISLNDLRKLMDHSPLKLRAYIALAKDTGLAPVDILNLKYGQVKGLLEKEPPAVLELIRKKTGTKFKTCLGHDALRFLREYLDAKRRARDKVEGWRIRKFIIPKGISDDEYIFTTGSIAAKKLSRKTLWLQFARTARRAGVDIQPYDLRRFFSTQLRTSSGTVGGLNELYIKYMMGHEIGVDDSFFKPTGDQVKTEYGQRYQSLALEGVAVSKADLEEAEEKADEKVAKVTDNLEKLTAENARLKGELEDLKKRGGKISEEQMKVIEEKFKEEIHKAIPEDTLHDAQKLLNAMIEASRDPDEIKRQDAWAKWYWAGQAEKDVERLKKWKETHPEDKKQIEELERMLEGTRKARKAARPPPEEAKSK